MGLRKTATIRGLTVPDAYHRIGRLRGSPSDPGSFRFEVETFASRDAAQAGPPFDRRAFFLKPLPPVLGEDGKPISRKVNFTKIDKAKPLYAQLYAELKRYDEFADAVDVLEA